MKLFAATSLLLCVGCGAAHIGEYQPKRREYEPIVAEKKAETVREDGSIWSAAADGNTLVVDYRALKANDVVTVVVEELASANRSADTRLQRESSLNAGADVLDVIRNGGDFNPDRLITARTDSEHDARGRTSRRDDVRFNVTATVTKVLPNGNLFLEGHRVVLVNDEEHHFYISGVARPIDIRRDNTISSIQLADAEIEFQGEGIISEGQKPGWLARLWNWINPL